MATYKPEELGIKEPEGGFQTGAWIQGRQYWGGTFSEPGQIHPQSNQKGAGERVSEEVIAQTAPENVEYVRQQRQEAGLNTTPTPTAPSGPQTQEEVTPYLQNYQGKLFSELNKPDVSKDSLEDIKAQVQPEAKMPEAIDYTKEFEKLREEQGLEDLEDTANKLKKQRRAIYSEMEKRRTTEEGKPVAMNVITGRISEVERQEQERLDSVNRQLQTVNDQLKTGYNVVSMYMDFKGKTYDDAMERYNTQFKRNMQLYQAVQDEEAQEWDRFKYRQKTAQNNLQLYANAITSGNMNYSNLSSDQKVNIAKLEAQAGLPIGFVQNLNMAPGDKMVTFNDETGEALMQDGSGNFEVVQTGMTPSPTGDGEELEESDYKEYLVEDVRAGKSLEEVMQFYGTYLDPQEILRLYDTNSPYGPHKETAEEIRRYGVEAKGGTSSGDMDLIE